jgi:K+-sensing histidine kinase KdpD
MTAQRTTLPDEPVAEASDPFLTLQLVQFPALVRYLSAVAMTALATLVAVAFDSQATIPNISLIFVLPVIVCAAIFGLGSSLCAAVLGALAYNFFLTEPRYTFVVDDAANIWAIALLFVVGCIASAVASTARRRADDAALLQRQAAALHVYSRHVVAANDMRTVVSETASTLEKLFHVPVVVMLKSEEAVDIVERRGAIAPVGAEMEAARSSLKSSQPVAGVYPFDTSRFDFWPVVPSSGQQAVIGLAFDPDERPRTPGVLVEIVGGVLALALDRQRLQT